MSTMNAPLQSDRKAWAAVRVGAFTGSTNGDLMTEPRSKAAKEAGELSETAKTLIKTKATEIVKGEVVKGPLSYEMKRGMALEPAMRYLLSKYWEPVDRTSTQVNGIWHATPDGLLRNGEPVDIKCTNEVDVLRFAEEVPDGDFAALKSWNKTYAYQLVSQAEACGSTHANLVYCTDKIKAITLSEEDIVVINGEGLHDEHGGLIAQGCEEIFDETGITFEYLWHDIHNTPGFTFIARRFEIPIEEIKALERAIKTAQVERDRLVVKYRSHLVPSTEEVEAISELLEGQDIETDEQVDVRRLEEMLHHLSDMPWPVDLKSHVADFGVRKARRHVEDALSVLRGTIADLK